MRLFFLFVTIMGCNQVNYQVGECIQKPDEVFVWRIKSINNDSLLLYNKLQNKTLETAKKQSWIKTTCPN